MEVIVVNFLDTVATVDVLTSSSTNSNCTLCKTNIVVLFERINKVDRKILVVANFITCFLPEIARPCSKDGGIVNEVY